MAHRVVVLDPATAGRELGQRRRLPVPKTAPADRRPVVALERGLLSLDR